MASTRASPNGRLLTPPLKEVVGVESASSTRRQMGSTWFTAKPVPSAWASSLLCKRYKKSTQKLEWITCGCTKHLYNTYTSTSNIQCSVLRCEEIFIDEKFNDRLSERMRWNERVILLLGSSFLWIHQPISTIWIQIKRNSNYGCWSCLFNRVTLKYLSELE